MSRLLDPRLAPALVEHYESRCTILVQPMTTNASSQPRPNGSPTVVSSMAMIPCRIGPMILIRPTDNMLLTEAERTEVKIRQVKLDRYCPEIVTDYHIARVDGVDYPIRGVEHDGSRHSTRLRCEAITP